MSRPPKHENLLGRLRALVGDGEYVLTEHAVLRMRERKVSTAQVVEVLTTGWHEAAKDDYDDVHHAWKYAIRGKIADGRELRVVAKVVAQAVVITVIDLGK